MINMKDIMETITMIQDEHLDIRTITMGISLIDCCDSDIDKLNCSLEEMKNRIEAAVPEMKVHVMHEDIFNSMHRI